MKRAQIIIVGGGISGLINAILLSRAGFKTKLFEKNKYPFHRVCGEYISNEVVPFLERHQLFPTEIGPSRIMQLEITSVSGNRLKRPLDLGGFGISRYTFDQFLAEKARASGVEVIESAVREIQADGNEFLVSDGSGQFLADLVIGAYGKRSNLDKELSRDFFNKRSPYVGVKYHLKGNFPEDMISLHNFDGGYCGINKIEEGKFNLCYLIHRNKVREMGDIKSCEENLLFKNPHLRNIFESGEFLFETPLVVNEISFSSKGLSKDGVIFSGDAAGTIAPLSGNGMAMAIRSAKYLSEAIIKYWEHGPAAKQILNSYRQQWESEFAKRIFKGRAIQKLFGDTLVSRISIRSGEVFPFLVNPLLKMTHGQPFS